MKHFRGGGGVAIIICALYRHLVFVTRDYSFKRKIVKNTHDEG
jgi:hypothetical protein